MQIISPAEAFVSSVLGRQTVEDGKKYRPLFQLQFAQADGVWLCMNIVTAELIALTPAEKDTCFGGETVPTGLAAELAARWFLVPVDFDDLGLAVRLHHTLDAMSCVMPQKTLYCFEVLPTTACNARCYYCVEHGTKYRTMSTETALAAVDYIERNCDPATRDIRLRWFGGEPLYNMPVIDLICTELQKRGITYHGDMVTNGYLFDDASARRAADLWHLKWVQITLDGTEEIYNRVKAYIYKDAGSAFARVTDNIGRLLDAGIEVRVRLNLDLNNFDDLEVLIGQLNDRFGGWENFSIYVARLFDESCARIRNRPQEDRQRIYLQQARLQGMAKQGGTRPKLNRVFRKRLNHCMANSDGSIIILPEGNLAKCDFLLNDHFVGDIWHDRLNRAEINWHRQTLPRTPQCEKCRFYLLCRYPQCCTIIPNRCDDFDKKANADAYRAEMRLIYQQYLKEHTS